MAKRALCIGINDYPGTGSDLSGCVNDANDWKAALVARGFAVKQLLDDKATKAAMVAALKSLVGGAKKGDSLVITYSGHGSWIPDTSGDEPDQKDEVLCPYDIGKNRPLTDDELHDIFDSRQRGVRIALISDSCHSGSVIRMAPGMAGASRPKVRFLPPARFLPAKAVRAAGARRLLSRRSSARPFGGVLLAGCQDTEYSYDADFGGRANGAFTYFALKALGRLSSSRTYRDWFKAIRSSLPSQNYPQEPNIQGTRSQKTWKILA